MTYSLAHRLIATASALIVVSLSVPGFGSNNVDLITGLNIDNRTGLFATGNNSAGVITTEVSLTPRLVLSLSTGRTIFQGTYQFRLSTRVGLGGQLNLNIFHQAGLQNTVTLTRTLSWFAQANASTGILDYSNALRLFDTTNDIAANRPDVQKFRFYNVGLSTGFAKRLSPRANGAISSAYHTQRPYGYDNKATLPFKNQDQVSLQMSYNRAITRRDTLQFDTSGSLVLNEPGSDFVPVQTMIGWECTLSETSNLNIRGGVMMAYQLSITDVEVGGEEQSQASTANTHWLPLAGISYNKHLNLKRRSVLSGSLTGGLSANFDQITASVWQQVLLTASGSFTFPSRWAISAQMSMVTLMPSESNDLNTQTSASFIEYPTTALLNIGLGYPIASNVHFQCGISSNARASTLWDTPVRFKGFEEVLFYLSISASRNILD